MDAYIGQQFGNYQLIRLLGRGGFADVYLGEHVYLRREAAIKVLQLRLAGNTLENFLNEARTIARLEHAHIVRVLDFGVKDTIPFLVMSYAPNGTLRQHHPKGSILPISTVITYIKQVGGALQYAHDQRLIHRDIKPENLLLSRTNEALLSDFGIARMTQSTRSQAIEEVAGTIAYMAPEQIQGKPRPASDQYSLGIIVYEWLTGDRPFQGSFVELCTQHMFASPPPMREKVLAISPAVEEVVLTTLAKEPQKRFGSVRAFANALEQAALAPSLPFMPSNLPTVGPVNMPTITPADMSTATPSNVSTATPAEMSTNLVTPDSPWPVASGRSATPEHPPASKESGPVTVTGPGATQLPPTIVAPVATTVRAESPGKSERRLSRRAVLGGGLGLAGLAIVGGGVGWWLHNQHTGGSQVQQQPHLGQLLYTYRGHPNYVAAVAWSPDGKRVASGSGDRTVQVWDATTGHNVIIYQGHQDVPYGVAWSYDGQRIASGSADHTVQIWSPTTRDPQALLTYPGHSDTVNAVAWSPSPNDNRIASASYDKTVQVWHATSTQPLYTFKGHSDAVWGVAWSPGATRIASASYDKTVRVWDASNGGNPFTYRGHSHEVHAVAWSPDGKYIASGGLDKTVQVWDAVTGNTVFTYDGHQDWVFAVVWSPDSKRIASGSADKSVWVWDALTGKNAFKYDGHWAVVNSVAWSHDGQHIASGGNDSTVQVWQAV